MSDIPDFGNKLPVSGNPSPSDVPPDTNNPFYNQITNFVQKMASGNVKVSGAGLTVTTTDSTGKASTILVNTIHEHF